MVLRGDTSRMDTLSSGGERQLALRRWSSALDAFRPNRSTDPSGVRGALRHRLARPTGILLVLTLLAAAILGLGNPLPFTLVAAGVAAMVGLENALGRAGRPMSPGLEFRAAEAVWLIGLALVAASAWTPREYHGEVVVVVCVTAAALVGVVESLRFAITWAALGAVSVAVGAAFGREMTAETVMGVVALGAGIMFGSSLQQAMEAFLGARRLLRQELNQVAAAADPFETAAKLLEPLARWMPVRSPSIVWFTADNRAVFLAFADQHLPARLSPGRELPAARNAYLRSQARHGPWLTNWTVREDDGGYSRDIAGLGIAAVAYVPFTVDDRLVGVVCAGLAEDSTSRAVVAEYLPGLVEFAEIAGTTLGPSLVDYEQHSTLARLIDDVLSHERYHPVFQPIRDLTTQATVGYEALTRFDSPIGTERMFHQADLVGRLTDLEVATLRAAMAAEPDLPEDCWLSLNCSPQVLTDTRTLAPLLEATSHRLVIELSEHEAITDYGPIGKAVARLGPNCQLAIDDAGAGFASLRHILEMHPAFVKLDLALVQGVATDPTRRALVAGFVHFAQDAGFTLIAEGIENAADLGVLRRLGVTLGQGYQLGRPVHVADVPQTHAATRARRRRAPGVPAAARPRRPRMGYLPRK
jgi:EAL domain-containing protein (putative c-di-GMP-specific phosphodiesterase class I)